jgi:hypothetical protein
MNIHVKLSIKYKYFFFVIFRLLPQMVCLILVFVSLLIIIDFRNYDLFLNIPVK